MYAKRRVGRLEMVLWSRESEDKEVRVSKLAGGRSSNRFQERRRMCRFTSDLQIDR